MNRVLLSVLKKAYETSNIEVINAMKKYDLVGEFKPINDVLCNGKKISGVGGVERKVRLESCYLTYKSHLIAEGCCAQCGEQENNLDKACVSNSGRHSIVGRNLAHIPILQEWESPSFHCLS